MRFIDLGNFSLYNPPTAFPLSGRPIAEPWHSKSLTMQSGTKANLSVPALVMALRSSAL